MSKINKIQVDGTIYDIEDANVPSWAREENKPDYNYDEIQNAPTIPTKTSELENDSHFLVMNDDYNHITGRLHVSNNFDDYQERKVDISTQYLIGAENGGLPSTLYINAKCDTDVSILENGTGTLYYKGNEVADRYYVDEQIANVEIGDIDLSDYATKTDYASSDNVGLVKTESYYGLHTSSKNGTLYCEQFSYDEYANEKDGNCFIGKGTLENVLEAKDYATKEYVDEQISNIETSGGSGGSIEDIIYGDYDDEIIIGYVVENGVKVPVYRKIFKGEKVSGSNLVFDTSNLNINKVLNMQGSTDRTSWVYPLMRYETSDNYTYAYYMPNDKKLVFTSGTSSWCSTGSVTIILDYTKKTN